MDEEEIRDLLGDPDEVGWGGMTSRVWKCSRCGLVHMFRSLVRPPAPCSNCAGIAFERLSGRGKDPLASQQMRA
ncbi:hypothetical protein AAW51_2170 [Caldimonas brevitalea]|uniref:Uncharacterized protein n=1 Tax=Caldimonas brevitalea TaxID=413882 RepID=A0A0G3BND4_9BURK|nr:hypothetical protein AAW51_2170 [Caldimonas brevitalea]